MFLAACGQNVKNSTTDSKTASQKILPPHGEYVVMNCSDEDASFSLSNKGDDKGYIGKLEVSGNSAKLTCNYNEREDTSLPFTRWSCSNERPARVNIGVNIIEDSIGTKAEVGIIPVSDIPGMYPEAVFKTLKCAYIYY